jgi:integrase
MHRKSAPRVPGITPACKYFRCAHERVGGTATVRATDPRTTKDGLHYDEAERLLDACSDHLQPLISEERGSERCSITPRVIAVLTNLPHRKGEVFRRLDVKAYRRPKRRHDTSGGSRFANTFGGACRRAKIFDFRPHDCRHTGARWHYRADRDLGALQRLSGWKSVAVVMRYVKRLVASKSRRTKHETRSSIRGKSVHFVRRMFP